MAQAGSSSSCGCSGGSNNELVVWVAEAQGLIDKIIAARVEKDKLYRLECAAALDWLRKERAAPDGIVPRQRTHSQLQWAAAAEDAAKAAEARALAGIGDGNPSAVGTDPGAAAEFLGAKPKSGAPAPLSVSRSVSVISLAKHVCIQ